MDASATIKVAAIDQVTGPLRAMGRAFSGMSKESKGALASVGKAMDTAKRKLKLGGMRRDLKKYTWEWKQNKKAVTGALTATKYAALGAAAGVGVWFQAMAESGDSTAKTADKLGLTTDELQKLRHAANKGGIAQQKFDTGMQRFTRRLSEARRGTGAAKEAFERLGITLKNSDGTAKSSSQVFMEVADRLNRVKDPANKVALAFKFFDSEGVGMVNMMNQGSKGIKELGNQFEAMGGVISEKTLRGSEGFLDNLADIQALLRGISGAVFGALLPKVNTLLSKLFQWGAANRELLVQQIVQWLENAGAAVEGFTEGVKMVAGYIRKLVPGLEDVNTGFIDWHKAGKMVAVLLGTLLAGKILGVVSGVLGLVKAVWALSAAFMASPIGWITAAIVGLGAAAYLVWEYWDEIKAYFAELWQQWGEWISGAIGWIEKIPGPIGWIMTALVDLGTKLKWLWDNWDTVLAGIKKGWEGLGDGIKATIDFCMDLWRGFLDFLNPFTMAEKGKALIGSLMDGIIETWKDLKAWLTEALDALIGWLPNWAREGLGIEVSKKAPDIPDPRASQAAAGVPANASQAAAAIGGRNTVNAKIGVEVVGPPGTRVKRIRQTGSSNVDIDAGVTGGTFM